MPSRISQKVAVSVVFVAALFVSLLDSSIANVALPSIGREFAVAPTGIDRISIAYLVASGWLGDRFGSKRVLLIALVGFTVASALCGLATSLTELVVFRALQGAAGGMLVPVGTAMLFRTFPPDERVRACAIIAIPTGLAPAIAPVLGGVLVTDASWRWVFFVNLPIGVAAGLFGALFVKEHTESDPGRFDVPGSLLSGVGLALVVYRVSDGPNAGWGSGQVLVSIVIGALLLTIMCVVELRTPAPIIPLRVFGNALFRKSTIVSVLRHALSAGRPRPDRSERGVESVPQRARRHRRKPAGQPVRLLATRTESTHRPRSGRRCDVHGSLRSERSARQFVVCPSSPVRLRLVAGTGVGLQPGGIVRDDHSTGHGSCIDVVQRVSTARRRSRRRTHHHVHRDRGSGGSEGWTSCPRISAPTTRAFW